jgi:hypothetical protein
MKEVEGLIAPAITQLEPFDGKLSTEQCPPVTSMS